MNAKMMNVKDLHASLREFVYYETRLLDERRFEQWYDLFDEDGVYWIPTDEAQTDKDTQPSIALENRMLLKLRIDRMQHAQAHSLHPQVRGLHVIQRPEILSREGLTGLAEDRHLVACNMLYMERQGEQQVTLGGCARYVLRRAQGGGRQHWRIMEKRVALLGCEGFLPAVQLFI